MKKPDYLKFKLNYLTVKFWFKEPPGIFNFNPKNAPFPPSNEYPTTTYNFCFKNVFQRICDILRDVI